MNKIGFACKFSRINHKGQIEAIPELNNKTTTVAWLNRQPTDVATARLWDLMVHNVQALRNVIINLSTLDENLRMFRCGSDILPVYTHRDWKWFWNQHDVIAYLEKEFAEIGALARNRNVRLSFHPGQFCVLASDRPEVVNSSIDEFEYHANVARWLGYGREFQDFKINVHIAGRLGPAGILAALQRMSPEARNCITIENDEMTWGIADSLVLKDNVALVLDIHHHFIHSGEYITPSDDRFKQIVDSWRGVRPVIHYSVSREDVLINHCVDSMPCFNSLISSGLTKSKLRAHSDYMWNNAVNEWALSFNDYADIMVESKAKNLASFRLYEYSNSKKQD